ncbi:MAG: DUF4271 domain-containing protein [Bacteroidetes bacterium]|nr:MAG: DUF4271 domain-containing protein [Bacteroidota bacterium]
MNEYVFELTERAVTSKNWYYLFIAVSFTLIALSRISHGALVPTMSAMFIRSSTIRSYSKESKSLQLLPGILMTVNYIVTTLFFSYQFLLEYKGQMEFQSFYDLIFLAAPVLYFLISQFFLVLIGFFSGELDVFRVPILINFTSLHVTGFLLSFLLIMYSIDLVHHREILMVSGVVFSIVTFWRIVRSAHATWSRGVSWYYIILYLCTLEILPLVVLFATFA